MNQPTDPKSSDRVAAEPDRTARRPVRRAPLPQWWWDQTLQTRQRIAAAVAAVLVVGIIALVVGLVRSSSDSDPGSPQADETTRQADIFVAGLPAARVATWDALAECESESDWGKATGNGFYGGLQMSQATWLEFGGTGSPHETTREVQIMIAEAIQAEQGWQAWPACSAELGLSG